MRHVLGGKFGAAVAAAKALRRLGVEFSVILSAGEDRIPAMPSLECFARQEKISLLSNLAELHGQAITFLSVEYDRVVHPGNFGGASRFFNMHFSLLPAYRGTMTSFWPIVLRERSTGVTLHEIDEGIDTGNIISQRGFMIGEEDTCRDLYFKYHEAAAALLTENLENVLGGAYLTRAQPDAGASSFPRFLYPYFPKEFRGSQLRLMERGDVLNVIRALIFAEYQLPVIDGRRIARISRVDFLGRNQTVPTNGGDLYALAVEN